MNSAQWNFEEYDPDRANLSGKIASIVKNVTLKNPGVLGRGAIGDKRPSDEAGLLAREGIQNCWDNARDRAAAEGVSPNCHLEFRFMELRNREKAAFVLAAGLHELANRADRVDKIKQGFADPETYEKLDDPDHPLRVMQLIEVSGTTGMYGPWSGKKSRLNLAMLNVGFNRKGEGGGGSYGYGKAALIRCSGVRVVAAYTAFNESVTDGTHSFPDDADRRFIAVNYWEEHDLDELEFTGWARLGSGPDGTGPFKDGEADEMASKFQIDLRDPAETSEIGGIGTTLVVVDPIVEPQDVLLGVERYWWPALVDKDWNLDIAVVDYSGEERRPNPAMNPDLGPFVKAYESMKAINGRTGAGLDNKRHKYLSEYQLPGAGQKVIPGMLSMDWDDTEGSWTWPKDDDDTAHRSLIALCRGPRMVVSYLEIEGKGIKPPYLRGVFITSDDKTNSLLTQTEAGMHLEWATDGHDPDVDPDAYVLAKKIILDIKSKVREAKKALFRPARTTSRSHLPELARFMENFFGGGKGTKKKTKRVPELRTISIQFSEPAEPETRKGGVCSIAEIEFSPMAEVSEEAPFKVEIEITYRIQEDGSGGSSWPCKIIKEPSGFTAQQKPIFDKAGKPVEDQDGKPVLSNTVILEGTLEREPPLTLRVESDPHDGEWTGQWDPVAKRVDQKGEPSDG
jgi:hypothetical protein